MMSSLSSSSQVEVEGAKRQEATSANSSRDRTLWWLLTKAARSGWSVPVEAAATTSSRPTTTSLCCADVGAAAAVSVAALSFGVLFAPTAASCIW